MTGKNPISESEGIIMKAKDAKKVMIDKITEAIKDFGEQARQDETLSLGDKCLQVDVLIDTLKFLDNYDENVRVLNQYYLNKNRWER